MAWSGREAKAALVFFRLPTGKLAPRVGKVLRRDSATIHCSRSAAAFDNWAASEVGLQLSRFPGNMQVLRSTKRSLASSVANYYVIDGFVIEAA
jgi:hypothetical protein